MADRNMEEEYFARLDAEAKAKLKAKLAAEQASMELEERRKLHLNKCGKCGSTMATQTFRGIEIEVCPDCNAVLLDPGELEQLAGKDSTDVFTSFFSMFGAGRKS